ncbi:hypothetical protein SBV1_1890004 [Verrucomicrobia bacterium]|nr:hypothetical protein SBV1_1890004 [Verrucomicrobiota bacterium]
MQQGRVTVCAQSVRASSIRKAPQRAAALPSIHLSVRRVYRLPARCSREGRGPSPGLRPHQRLDSEKRLQIKRLALVWHERLLASVIPPTSFP